MSTDRQPKAIADSERSLPDLAAGHTAARQAVDDWKARLAVLADRVGLGGIEEPDVFRAALEQMAEIEAKLLQVDDIERTRIGTMQRDLDAFAGTVAALTVAVAQDLTGRDAAPNLVRRLAAAREAQARRDQAIAQLGKRVGARATSEERRGRAHARIEPLLQAAGVGDVAALSDAIERSDRRRQKRARAGAWRHDAGLDAAGATEASRPPVRARSRRTPAAPPRRPIPP